MAAFLAGTTLGPVKKLDSFPLKIWEISISMVLFNENSIDVINPNGFVLSSIQVKSKIESILLNFPEIEQL